MKKGITDQLIRKYLRHQCTREEIDMVENWLVDPKNRERVNRLMRSQWKKPQDNDLQEGPDTSELLAKLHKKIDRNDRKPAPRRSWFKGQWIRIAAVLIIPVLSLGVYFTFNFTGDAPDNIVRQHFENLPGQRSRINLPDGSVAWLNAASKLSFPEDFEPDKREIILEGEAFFEVIKNPDKPFIVRTGEIDVKVLGTSFNVAAFVDEPFVETTLVTGSVALKKSGIDEDFLMLEPSQQALYSKERQSFVIKDVDTGYTTSWKDGSLKFNDASFSHVIRKLERWYGVQIEYDTNLLNADHLTFTVQGESLERILDLMQTLIPIKYTLEDRNVKIESL